MSVGQCLIGFFTVLLGIAVGVGTIAYFSWAMSFVMLKGYTWFLADIFGVTLTQAPIAAMIAMLSAIISLSRNSIEPVDTRSTASKIGYFIGHFASPWTLLLLLWIITLL